MKTARKLGISVKRLDGWEPVEHTTYEYDDQTGRIRRSTTTREVEWDETERTWMLALDHYEGTICQRCGQPLAETLDPMHDPDNPDGTHHYVADDPVQCNHCLVLMRSERKWAKINERDHGAFIHSARLVTRPKRDPNRKKGQVKRANSVDKTSAVGGGVHGAAGSGAVGDSAVREGQHRRAEKVRDRTRQGRTR